MTQDSKPMKKSKTDFYKKIPPTDPCSAFTDLFRLIRNDSLVDIRGATFCSGCLRPFPRKFR